MSEYIKSEHPDNLKNDHLKFEFVTENPTIKTERIDFKITNVSDQTYKFGANHELEVKMDEEWHNVPYTIKNNAFPASLQHCEPDGSVWLIFLHKVFQTPSTVLPKENTLKIYALPDHLDDAIKEYNSIESSSSSREKSKNKNAKKIPVVFAEVPYIQ